MTGRDVPVRSLIAAVLFLAASFAAPVIAAAQTPPPAPYSLPWQLRPVTAGTVLRVDETIASFKVPGGNETGMTVVTSLLATIKLGARWAPLLRITVATNEPPAPQLAATAVSNPLLGLTYARPFGKWKAAAFAAVTLPTGDGGGDTPDAGQAAAMARAIAARSAMDNALFAVNFWTAIGGVGGAYVHDNLTVQGEATLLRLTQSRGPAGEDGARTNFTGGIHAGWFMSHQISMGAEYRMQRWLTDAAPVRRDPSARQQTTFAIGPRAHFKLAGKKVMRPGIAWVHMIDNPLARENYDAIQLDVPLAF